LQKMDALVPGTTTWTCTRKLITMDFYWHPKQLCKCCWLNKSVYTFTIMEDVVIKESCGKGTIRFLSTIEKE
jgi:hypothetical protein